jgi:hypothetical protein
MVKRRDSSARQCLAIYKTLKTMNIYERIGWEVLQHLHYSSESSPSYFNLYGLLKVLMGSQKLEHHQQAYIYHFLLRLLETWVYEVCIVMKKICANG